VRADGDAKTEKSRRTLCLPVMAVDALRTHKKRQEEELLAAGSGTSTALSSLPGPVAPWTRLTFDGSLRLPARRRRSGSSGRRGNCDTRSCHS
jgi:hypothetical protein